MPNFGNNQNLSIHLQEMNGQINWYIQIVEYYSVVKRNELPIHDTTCRNLNSILLNERIQSEMTAYCVIPNMEKVELKR